MAAFKIDIEMNMTPQEFRKRAETDPVTAAMSLDGEIEKFQKWVTGRGMDPLTRYETQILREYLGFKLLKVS